MGSADYRFTLPGDLEQTAISEQLERILAHPAFKTSARCQNLLRYVVDRSLRGECEQIKERTLGIEVFERKANYDTGQDHVVRAAAAEVRKRLAQYYQEPGHEAELNIQLRAGSYIPEFQWPGELLSTIPPRSHKTVATPSFPAAMRSRGLILALAIAIAALALVVLRVRFVHHAESLEQSTAAHTSVERFWRKMLAAPGRILICAGAPRPTAVENGIRQPYAFAVARMAGYLGQQGRNFELRSSSSTSSADLDEGPSIIIGEFVNGNSWAINTVAGSKGQGRFFFGGTPGKGPIWIEDSKNPSAREWSIDSAASPSELKQDYVILVQSFQGNSPSLLVAGLGENGTIGGINCLVDTRCLDQLYFDAPKGSASENSDVEAVLAIPIVDGISRPAQVVAVTSRQFLPVKK